MNIQVCGEGGEGTKSGGEHNADVPDIDRNSNSPEEVIYDTAGGHQTRINGSSNNTTQRVPCCRIKPVPEFLFGE